MIVSNIQVNIKYFSHLFKYFKIDRSMALNRLTIKLTDEPSYFSDLRLLVYTNGSRKLSCKDYSVINIK